MRNYDLRLGSNLDVLPTLADNSVDAIVTDPPYELGFMGKSWDSTGIAFNPDVWRECLRVLKPGGHLLAFSGSRTYHRMAVAIEDAGFQIRDQIMWIYGSGFPKSLDVSKAIDKSSGENRQRQLQFTEWMRSTGITASQINQATNSNMGNHYLTDKQQPAIATADLFDKLRPYLPEVPEYIERLVAERTGIEWTAYVNREVVGIQLNAMSGWNMDGTTKFADRDITAPSTPEAQQWQGWGTALKPAHEPIVLARKPLVGTVAANVLEWGTGGLNIDGSRVGSKGDSDQTQGSYSGSEVAIVGQRQGGKIYPETLGRFPANVIHDGLAEEWARYFYCAKASKRDRNEGLEGLPEVARNKRAEGGKSILEISGATSKNHHPTVKPTDLMRYLCKLITPPGGTVLDPFMGSGSTGKGAIIEGFDFIGIELSEEYLAIAKARIEFAKGELQ